MCFGAEAAWVPALIGSVLSGVGTVVTTSEANKNAKRQAKARNDVLNSTLAKNEKIADQSRAQFDQTNKRLSDQNAQEVQDKAQADRTATLETAITPTNASVEAIPTTGSAPAVVQSEIAQKMLDVFSKSKADAKNLGKLSSYGDSWFQQGLDQNAANRDIGVLADRAAGNTAIMPYSQDFAQQRAYRPVSPIGGILQGIGGMLGSMGGGGGFYDGGNQTPQVGAGPLPRPNPRRGNGLYYTGPF